MTSQGHPYARFRRALNTAMPTSPRPPRASWRRSGWRMRSNWCCSTGMTRWIGRLVAERPRVRLSELELAAGAFREALHSDRGETTLREKIL